MRLIDADSLESETCSGCVNYEHKYANCIDCALANAPTIDAIPVVWLNRHKTEYLDDWGENPVTVEQALKMWQKEQEAQK